MGDFKNYLVEYRYQGVEWGTTIKAQSFEDAKARIETMGAFGRVKGEVMATVPAIGGPLVRAWVWLMNLGRANG
jgi:hypothetical protein